ncbi:MFS general substrate transporter [Lophiostoma macrostomum CBS 122681]|uniref:MFS general substrate transporter n=1 Tax=Lophiostoma macrostomum CBS 122681 TaxID=1314788 RepID=A0A6A6STW4_9PLEO|nr:MFS general substrate transporter [Lophiostoma macrostomum CBS 122681]
MLELDESHIADEGLIGSREALTQDESADSQEDPRLERHVKWKLDATILPLLVSVQFLAQMGKSDLGNAQVAGLSDELKLTPKGYSNLSIMLNVGYLVFQLPGTMLLKKIGPSYQFGIAMISWGMFSCCVVAAHSLGAMMALRLLVGASEAFIHGTLIYLSFWYRYDELATRGALFDGSSALAGAFNGLISHRIQVDLDGHNGWRAWRWIFLVEGILPIAWGFVVLIFLPSTPETVQGIFTAAEKNIIIRRSRSAHNTGDDTIRFKAILEVLTSPVFWLTTGMNCGVNLTTGSLANFLPPILDGLGYEGEKAQLMSAIVYACAFVQTMITARIADKTNHRGFLIIANTGLSLVGFGMLLGLDQPASRFAGTCILTAAMYPCLMLVLVWLAMNMPGYSHRTSAVAMTRVVCDFTAQITAQATDGGVKKQFASDIATTSTNHV